jgi:hypothetical protein
MTKKTRNSDQMQQPTEKSLWLAHVAGTKDLKHISLIPYLYQSQYQLQTNHNTVISLWTPIPGFAYFLSSVDLMAESWLSDKRV